MVERESHSPPRPNPMRTVAPNGGKGEERAAVHESPELDQDPGDRETADGWRGEIEGSDKRARAPSFRRFWL